MPEVTYTAELKRILSIPRRAQPEGIEAANVAAMTDALRRDTCAGALRPVQAAALLEVMLYGGVFGAIGVGEGKTLITLFIGYVLEARSYLLLLPANLIEKTRRDHARYAAEFLLPPLEKIELLSYEMLSRVQGDAILARVDPDVIGADEVHRLKNRGAACTKKITRWMDKHPATKFAAFSGTVMQKSVRDCAHIIRWCLKGNAPVPRMVAEIEQWAFALDEDMPDDTRFQPGALLRLCGPEELTAADPIVAARRGFRRRLIETPGVVSTIGEGERVDASIYVSAIKPTYKPITDEHFAKLRKQFRTPDDWELMTGAEVWAYARQLSVGFHYVWAPRPPEEWRDARREWNAFVRETLGRSRTLDSELHVANAVDDGRVNDGGALERWRAIRDTFKPNSVPIWHDDSVLKLCGEWMAANDNGIVWTDHNAFGEALAKLTKRPYFGAQGRDARGRFIDDAAGPIIASISANKEGRNLQRWARNLVTAFPDNADRAEQLIGRTHRPGQKADEVTIEILVGCFEHVNAFRKAMSGAQTIRDTVGAAQKLLIADVTEWPSEDEIAKWRGPRWSRSICVNENVTARHISGVRAA